jgi:hypothetical protein
VLWPTIDAIDQAFQIGMPLNNEEELRSMAREFSSFSHGELEGCVIAIDGWVCRTRKPYRKEVNDVMAYRNRHDCWGIVVLAGCNAHCIFKMFSCKNSGSTNDTIAWDLSYWKYLVEEAGALPPEFFGIGK